MATTETAQPQGKALPQPTPLPAPSPRPPLLSYRQQVPAIMSLSQLRDRILKLTRSSGDRAPRRRPFSTWMKKLANLKGGSSAEGNGSTNGKPNNYKMKGNAKKQTASKNNNPYPESGRVNGSSAIPTNGHQSFSTVPTGNTMSSTSLNRPRHSINLSEDGHPPPTNGTKSTAMSTDVAHSDAAPSHGASSGEAATTVGYNASTSRGNGSTFSSPAPSVRSLTTTLTTIHSAAAPTNGASSHSNGNANSQGIQFSHQFPSSPLPSALPAHLAPHGSGGHPATYNTATANNLLTDNASILTLASSSKRRRRRSMDTDASVRALAPSSLFGGSRESLPLSTLSASIEPMPIPHRSQPSGGLNERASIYSATGVAPALPSERNSYYAGKGITADGGSVKSGLLGHGRNDSISGSIGGAAAPSSPLSPRDTGANSIGRLSRTNSGWEDGEKYEASLDEAKA